MLVCSRRLERLERLESLEQTLDLDSGYRDLITTTIYTHVLNRGGRGVLSPAALIDFDIPAG